MFAIFRNGPARDMRARRRPRILRRFVRHKEGAAAVEFAMVSVPFLALLFAIMETGLVFFAGQALETATADSARKIMTGQADGWDVEKFKKEVCDNVYGLFDCNKILVNVKSYSSFSEAQMARPVDENGNVIEAFQASNPGDIVIARLMYEWPVHMPLPGLADLSGNKRLLVATAAFRNEPYK